MGRIERLLATLAEVRILAPVGLLGYSYPEQSFRAGLESDPHLIAVDAGSTDAGPHKLGKGVGIVSREATKRHLLPMVRAAVQQRIPLVVGSSGGSGAAPHVECSCDIVVEILCEHQWRARVALIGADVPVSTVKANCRAGLLEPLRGVHSADETTIAAYTSIVAQTGVEPIIAALEQGAEIVLCGRSYAPCMTAALPIVLGFPAGLALHMGKILECGAQCAIPGAASDCMLDTLTADSFVLEPLNPQRRCTPVSVAAHTLDQKSHPAQLPILGGMLNLEDSRFEAVSDRAVLVSGSRFEPSSIYRVKLEGAVLVGHRTVCLAVVRDSLMITALNDCMACARAAALDYGGFEDRDDVIINFLVYDRDSVLGTSEPMRNRPASEVGIVIEAIAPTQEEADVLCSLTCSSLLHYHYEGRKSTSGNLAFPFAPSDLSGGPVSCFTLNHTMPVRDPLALFPITWIENEHQVDATG